MAQGKGGADFGTTLGNLLIPQTMAAMQTYPLRQKEIEKAQTQDEGLKVLQNMIRLGAPMPAMQKVGALAFPEVAAAKARENIYPTPPKPMLIGKDQRAFIEDKTQPNGLRELIGAVPDMPKVPDILIPGVLEAEIKKAQASRAPEKPDEVWTPMTPADISSAGLDPAGTYQRNSKGQIQVITQPKQNNPTEAQQKYAFNARRLAGAMETLGGIFKADPGAVSSGTLEATQESWIPGVPAVGRLLAGNNEQIVRNNMGDVIDAALTLGTGAAYSKEQLEAQRAALLPRAGESDEVKADKFKKLLTLYDQAKTNAHSAGVDLPDPAMFESIYKPKSLPKAPPKFGGVKSPIVQPPGPAPIGKNGKPMIWVPDDAMG